MKRNQLTLLGLAVAGLMTCAMIGCGAGDVVGNAVNDANKTNVARVANAYAMFQMRHAGEGYRGPKDEAELKAFMQENAETMTGMGIDDYDAVFVSERDDEAIKVRWGIKGSSRGCYDAIAFETTGSGGSRLVGFASGLQEEIEDESHYNNLFEGKHKPDLDRTKGETPKYDSSGNRIN